jgi:dTDP-4-amino-4,6-dideoxygalactose transaminase
MDNLGISTDIHYPYSALSIEPLAAYRDQINNAGSNGLTNSHLLMRTVVSVPMGPWMSDEQIEAVAVALQELKNEHAA